MDKKRTELIVSAIRSGTVIDHIPSDKTFQVINMLNLEDSENQVYFGTNLYSDKYISKGIIKISDTFFQEEEINKIALVAPTATLIEIEDYEITKKQKVNTPTKVKKIVKCFNPKCVTNIEDIPTEFKVISDHKGNMKLSCHYCEKTMAKENIEFI
ncbi:MAG: aspartate carbamoyltransferase regulatory subunit [Marinilabiliales bacterium]|nr:MAG: aspartate carbamoyltransferase regulatory subunit [Marinilabiliales bacterium]